MTEKLSEYNKKRDFSLTPEPKALTENGSDSLRFVVQHHLARRDHYDLRLESEGTMMSWAVPKGPSYDTAEKRLAIKVEDHPIEYRNFEGTIPKGEYGGGTVMIWDEGYWLPLNDVKAGLKQGVLKFELKGIRLMGKWSLVRLKESGEDNKENWLLLKEKDEYSKDTDDISQYITSIRTNRTIKEIEEGRQAEFTKNPFNKADVQLAKLASKAPRGEDWVYELKYDGYRILAYIEANNVRLVSRNGNDYTKQFQDVASSLTALSAGRAMVLDGEMTVIDEAGRTDFQALQNYIKKSKDKSLIYYVFDILALDGNDLRSESLLERKDKLKTIMENAPNNLHYSRHIEGRAEECFEAACKANMEGIIGKRSASAYTGSRNGDWIKLKCGNNQEFVIGGYTLSSNRVAGLSSLLLGQYEGDDLVYIGRVGTGFTESLMKELREEFKILERDKSPFKKEPKPRANEKITYLKPELIANVKFQDWTLDNLLRHTSFQGLRRDKDPKDVKREYAYDAVNNVTTEGIAMKEDTESLIKQIKITNPDKVIYNEPLITKADVIDYYAKVSERMLNYINHRILSVVRCPKGISDEPCFYKKHPLPSSKGIVTIPVISSRGKEEDYFYIESALGLLSEAQMGTLEFHTWGSRADNMEKPDIMVFDLDPDEGMELDKVRLGVKDLRSVLNELSLVSYLKTSGGKGYHVTVPFKAGASWDDFYGFAKRIAQVLESRWPERYTVNVRKAARKDKIFIDWMRNGIGATSIAPYSLRARKGAKVSMPISWNELDSVAPDGIDILNALNRIESPDPWQGFFNNSQEIR